MAAQTTRNETRRQAMMGVEKERKTLMMKLWVDRANLIRGSGAVVHCGKAVCCGSAIRRTDFKLTVDVVVSVH